MAEIVRNGNEVLIKTGARIDTINAGDFEREINPVITESGVNIVFDC